jgi:hypothetical protein
MSEIDRYLDELLDRLAGTGAVGRRALAEAEDHLRAAVADGVARKLPQEQAEHEAVVRFGPSARIARQLRRAHRGARLSSALSGLWLLAGLAVTGIGVAYLASGASIGVMLLMHPEHLPTCTENVNRICTDTTPVMQHAILAGLAVLGVGAIVLLGRWLATRFTRLAPATRRFPQLAAVVFALAGFALLAQLFTTMFTDNGASVQHVYTAAPWFLTVPGGLFTIPQGPGPVAGLIASVVALTAAIAAIAWGAMKERRPSYLS